MKRNILIDLLIVAVLALAVRVVYIGQLAHTPFFDTPIWFDTSYHDTWARSLNDMEISKQGEKSIERYHDNRVLELLRMNTGFDGVYFRAPLYPYFLGAVYMLTGGESYPSRLPQAFLGMITAVLAYLLALSLTRKRAIALIAGVGSALYGMLVYFDGELLLETLFIPLLLAALLAYHRTRNSGKDWHLLIPGLLLGLAVITRPNALVILPIFLIDLFTLKGESGSELPLLKRSIAGLLLLIGCLLPILPVTLHNVIRGNDMVLISSQGGFNFYIGNNSKSDGLHSYIPGLGPNWDVPSASQLAYQAEGRLLKPSEVSSYYYKLGRQYIVNMPLDWAKLMVKKFYAFWNHREIANNRDLYFFKGETWIMPLLRVLGFWLLAPLGLLGWWLSWRKKLLPGWFIWSIPVYTLSVIAFFVTARFRTPLIPLLLIMSGVAIMQLLSREPGATRRDKLVLIAILIGLGIFVNSNLIEFQVDAAHSHFSLAGVHMTSGDLKAAKGEYIKTLEENPNYGLAHLNLGMIAYKQGDPRKAEEEYLKELEVNPNDAMALNNLGALRFEEGKLEEAMQYYDKAYNLQPNFAGAAVNLAESIFNMGLEKANAGETEQAAGYFQRACELDDSKAHYFFNFALTLGRLGYQDAAMAQLQKSLQIDPNYEPAKNLYQMITGQASSDGTNANP